MKNIILFGASGNIGSQCLDLLEENKDKYQLVAISIGKNDSQLEKILKKFSTIKIVYSQKKLFDLEKKFQNIKFIYDDILKVFEVSGEVVINAVSGFVGLPITLKAIEKNLIILNANKESFVAGGNIIKQKLKTSKTKIYPLDSEHCAIFQCLENNNHIDCIYLTASGGSFLDYDLQSTKNVDYNKVISHPNWNMGLNITINSSTMFNKAFEILEAYHLFDTKKIIVLIHRQSIIHSMVQFCDGSIKAQLSTPNMKQVINYFLNYPKRKSFLNQKNLDFQNIINLDLVEIDQNRFKPIKWALQCLNCKNSKSIALLAANEVCVKLFLQKRISFYQITEIVEKIFLTCEEVECENYNEILEFDLQIRNLVYKEIGDL